MPSDICAPFSQIIDPLCNIGMYTPHNTIKHTHFKILASALECQVSQGDTNGEVVDRKCNLANVSK
jgi:hypothetical protein